MSAYNLPGGYDMSDSMMVDLSAGGLLDPLQFSSAAALSLASSAEHAALLESLSDAADLFIQRNLSEEEMTLELAGGLLPSQQDLISQRLSMLNTELKVGTIYYGKICRSPTVIRMTVRRYHSLTHTICIFSLSHTHIIKYSRKQCRTHIVASENTSFLILISPQHKSVKERESERTEVRYHRTVVFRTSRL